MTTYVLNDCELDTVRGRLRRAGSDVPLRPKALLVLTHLIENRDRVVTKDELMQVGWPNVIVTEDSLTQLIAAIRRAIDPTGTGAIRTVAKRGYAIDERAIRIMPDHAPVSAQARMARPSVGVLPFAIRAGGPAGDFLADGLAEQLVCTLGQVPWLFVADAAATSAALTSTSTPAEAGRLLGLDYVLCGSLHSLGERLRLTIRLVASKDGRQLWAATLDGRADEFFDLQDALALKVATGIEPKVRVEELRRCEDKHGSLTAFECYLRAMSLIRSTAPEALDGAAELLEQALRDNDRHAPAHAALAWLAALRLPQGRDVDVAAALDHALEAIRLAPDDCDALAMGGYALGFLQRQPETGIPFVERALSLNGFSVRSHSFLGWLLLYAARYDEAIAHFDWAVRHAPIDEFAFRSLTGKAFACMFLERYEAAVAAASRARAAAPAYTICHRVLAASLAHLGEAEGASRVISDLADRHPGLTLERYGAEMRFTEPAARRILMDGLRIAGLRER